MSKNVFYSDLDIINDKGVLVTGHGKGIVARNSIINGRYIANDMVRLELENKKLLGYQGYVKKENNKYVLIEYLLYFYDELQSGQPKKPEEITVDEYIKLSKHNIITGERAFNLARMQFQMSVDDTSEDQVFEEYKDILEKASQIKCYKIPFTNDENQRAQFIHRVVV